MLNSIRKDNNRRILVKRFEIDRLQNKILSSAIALLDSSVFLSENDRLKEDTDQNKFSTILHSASVESSGERIESVSNFSSKKNQSQDVKSAWKKQALRSTPRNSSRVRIRNRCIESGRSRAVFNFCKLSRIRLKIKASQGLIPGLRKSSW